MMKAAPVEACRIMLKAGELVPLDEVERQLYLELVPDDHFLRRLASLRVGS